MSSDLQTKLDQLSLIFQSMTAMDINMPTLSGSLETKVAHLLQQLELQLPQKSRTMGQELNFEILRDFLLDLVETCSSLAQPNKTTFMAHHAEYREQWRNAESILNTFPKMFQVTCKDWLSNALENAFDKDMQQLYEHTVDLLTSSMTDEDLITRLGVPSNQWLLTIDNIHKMQHDSLFFGLERLQGLVEHLQLKLEPQFQWQQTEEPVTFELGDPASPVLAPIRRATRTNSEVYRASTVRSFARSDSFDESIDSTVHRFWLGTSAGADGIEWDDFFEDVLVWLELESPALLDTRRLRNALDPSHKLPKVTLKRFMHAVKSRPVNEYLRRFVKQPSVESLDAQFAGMDMQSYSKYFKGKPLLTWVEFMFTLKQDYPLLFWASPQLQFALNPHNEPVSLENLCKWIGQRTLDDVLQPFMCNHGDRGRITEELISRIHATPDSLTQACIDYRHLDVAQVLVASGIQLDPFDGLGISDAAEKGDLTVVKIFMLFGVSVNQVNHFGWTPLHLASGKGYHAVVKFLLDNHADIESKTNDGWTSLYVAAAWGHLSICEMLVDRGAFVDATSHEGWTPLHAAAGWKHLQVCKFLVSKGSSVEAKNTDGLTPLFLAVRSGDLEICEFFVSQQANVLTRSNSGESLSDIALQNPPMHSYIKNLVNKSDSARLEVYSKYFTTKFTLNWREFIEQVKQDYSLLFWQSPRLKKELNPEGEQVTFDNLCRWLGNRSLDQILKPYRLPAGDLVRLDEEIKSRIGREPINREMDIIENGLVDIAECLRLGGFSFEASDSHLLFDACHTGNLEKARAIITLGGSVQVANKDGWTPMFPAAQGGHVAIVRLLMRAKANIDHMDNDGWTPLFLACFKGQAEVVEYLVRKGANIEHASSTGWTPLYLACLNGHYQIVEFLVHNNAIVNTTTNEGETPLHAAAFKGHLHICRFLVDNTANLHARTRRGQSVSHVAKGKHQQVYEYLRSLRK